MKSKMLSILSFIAVTLIAGNAFAGDLGYTTLKQQSGSDDTREVRRARVAAGPNSYYHVATSGSVQITGTATGSYTAVLDSVAVNRAVASTLVTIYDGTNVIAVIDSASKGVLPLNVQLTTGTLSLNSSGTADITVTYK